MRDFLDRIRRRPASGDLPADEVFTERVFDLDAQARALAHVEIIEREAAITALAIAENRDPLQDIIEDRQLRWSAYLKRMTVPRPLQEWEARMSEAYGPTVRVWHADLRWLLGLLVVRYGESEHHWPREFQADDLLRALKWEEGDVPAAVNYGRARMRAAAEVVRAIKGAP